MVSRVSCRKGRQRPGCNSRYEGAEGGFGAAFFAHLGKFLGGFEVGGAMREAYAFVEG